MINKKVFMKIFLTTALPIALQNLLQNSLSFVDTLMIGRLGENSIAAVGLCGQVFFLVSVFLFGIASASGIFFSQYWGAVDKNSIQKALGLAIICGEIIAFVFSVVSVFAPRLVMRFFVEDELVIELGCSYLRRVGFSYMFTSISMTLNSLLRATGDSKTPMQITFISMVCDVVLNYILIFVVGWGVAGAAIATAISRVLETTLLLRRVFTKCPVVPAFNTMFKIKRSYVKKFFQTATPVILDDGLWAVGMTIYKMIHAHMGVSVLASANVMGSIEDLFFVLSNGLGAATAVLIGNEIGRGKEDDAFEESKLCLVLGLVGGFIMTCLMAGTSRIIPRLFNLSDEVYRLTSLSMLWFSLLMPMKAINHINIIGILRSGGDTKFVFRLEMCTIWLVGVPLTALSGLVWGVPIYFVYLITNIEDAIKLIVCLPRIYSKKWIHSLTEKECE